MASRLEVWKFTLEVVDEQRLWMPRGAHLLHVADQYGKYGKLNLWALVCVEWETVERSFHVFGTGHALPPRRGLEYVGTVVTAGGDIVWHVFDGGEVA